MTIPRHEQDITVALGTNLGSLAGGRRATLAAALAALQRAGLRLVAVSRFFATPCFPAGSGPDYVNAVAVVRGPDDPLAVLDRLHDIEAAFDRARTQRWGARTLDLDLLAMGGRVLPDAQTEAHWRLLPPDQQIGTVPDELVLPHPRVADRGFVLVPWADIAPDWEHPVTGLTVRQMVMRLPPDQQAEPIAIA